MISELKNVFAARLKGVQESLYADAVKRGWFTRRPDSVRARWYGLGVLVVIAAVGVTIALAIFTHWALLGIPLIVAACILLFAAGRMPARTAKGTAMLRRVRGFRTVIETAETHMARWAEKELVFTRFLPFAIVFGCTDSWAKAFEGLGVQPDTSWYVSSQPVRLRTLRRLDGGVRGDDRRHDRVDPVRLGVERVLRRRVLRRRWRRWRRRQLVSVRIVFSEDGRDFHRRGWHELVQADPAGTFFHTPAYLKLYWEEFGEQPDHLLLAFAEEDDGTQVGAVAFERIGETLRFLGGTEVTDYMGPVGLPEAGRVREGAVDRAARPRRLARCRPPRPAGRPDLVRPLA